MSHTFQKLRFLLKVDQFGGYYALGGVAILIVLVLAASRYVDWGELSSRDSGTSQVDSEDVPDTGKSQTKVVRKMDPQLAEKAAAADLRILFIGNEHTNRHDIPGLLEKLLASTDPQRKVLIASCSKARFQLTDHMEDELTKQMLEAVEWDYIVLQGYRTAQTTIGIETIGKLESVGKAKIVLFPLWGLQTHFQQAKLIHQFHIVSAKKLKADVLPTGLAWMYAHQLARDLKLYYVDNDHSNLTGAYLAACVMYFYLADEKAQKQSLGHIDLGAEDEETLNEKAREQIHQISKASIKSDAFIYDDFMAREKLKREQRNQPSRRGIGK